MNYLSVCSGIEAATAAWHPLGWKPVAFSEIEPFPSNVLAWHYPFVPNWGDMTKFREWPDASVDLLVGGTPCQAFSVAGLRKGLADPRGNLALVFLGIADRYRPKWIVWENVPGVLSSNGGRDFGSFLGALVQLGYGFAYRVLDAQYFGLAQRRKRVFVVGCLGDWRRPAAVLFERHGLQGHPPPSREARQAAPAGTIGGAHGHGRADEAWTNRLIASTGEISHCLNAGGMGRQDYETETRVAHPPVIAFHHNAQACQLPGPDRDTTISDALTCSQQAAVAFSCKDHGADAGEIAPTLRSMSHSGSHANGGGGQVAVCVAGDVAHTLKAEGFDASGDGTGRGQPIVASAASAVRRLTPRECERLQGFPTSTERLKIDVCIDLQSGFADAVLSCLRWQNSASLADGSGSKPPVSHADQSSGTHQVGLAPLAAAHVLLGYEDRLQEVRSRGKLIWSANGAEQSSVFHPFTQTGVIARALAPPAQELANLIRAGKAGSPASIRLSIPAKAGSGSAFRSGSGTAGNVAAVESGRNRGTFTTLELGQLNPTCDSRSAILCCSALRAIAGLIPSETLPENFSLEISVEAPYTLIPMRGKPAADGPRYKALGNSMAVPVMAWIGERIAAVDAYDGFL